ncbi:7TM GPCR Srsx domain containing protein [Trichuris trichiura]|uniref:7TM GPCR Srsx domain containing protein n=1 Tax=Trichuris trichiura TaxID=36087 RepID=A0A077YWQ2_TRITR|nr:7TM GPCR Srsx domain containing protein [Trichuris trichiura]
MSDNSSIMLNGSDSPGSQLEMESALRNLSKTLVVQYLPMFYTCLPVEAISILLTIFGFTVILIDAKIRSKKTFLLMATLFFGYFLVAFGSLLSIAVMLISLHLNDHAVVSSGSCFAITQPSAFGFSLVADTSFTMAIDRCLAIVFPVWYNKQYRGWMLHCQMLVITTHCVLVAAIVFARLPNKLLPICTSASDASDPVQVAQMAIKSTLLGLTVLIYLILICYIKMKLYVVKDDAQLYSRRQRHLKSRLLSTLMICILIHVATVCVGSLVGWLVMREVDPAKAMSVAKYGVITETSGPLNVIFIYARTRELQVSLHNSFSRVARLFGVKIATKVMPTGTHSFGTKYNGSFTTLPTIAK